MSEFLDPFRGEQIDWAQGRPIWNTLAVLRYRDGDDTLVIPADFRTDLASVPRWPFAWWIAGGRGIRSSVLHDFPYQFGFWWIDTRDGWLRRDVGRTMVDRVFHESLLADPISGVGSFVARLMWGAVRVGGRGAWGDHERSQTLNPIWSSGAWGPPEAP